MTRVGLAKHEVAAARQLIADARWIGVISHERPDGDAVGSLLALSLALARAGKQVAPVLGDGLPGRYRFLPGSAEVLREFPRGVDLLISVDCSDLDRLGVAPGQLPRSPDINIDHHPTNFLFARFNLIEVEAVATAEMIAMLLPRFGLTLSKSAADALLFGVITDTLGFRTNNMTPRALRIAADLVEAGADLPGLYYTGLLRRSFEAARFWGAGLTALQKEDRLAWTSLTLEDRRSAGYPGRDDADLINILTMVEAVDVIVVFTEQSHGKVKVSWRSKPSVDVARLALLFGGGGHAAAAGAEVSGDLAEVQEKVLQATRELLDDKIYNKVEGIEKG